MVLEKAIVAGGCFWGVQELMRTLPGVVLTRVGYTGGTTTDPTYESLCGGRTGHVEAVEVIYDADAVNYRGILEFFFKIHDPTTLDRQGHDKGSQYGSAIFTLNEDQKKRAIRLIAAMERSGRWPGKIVTRIRPVAVFYEAEPYHQDYLQTHPGGYSCHWVRPDWAV